MDRLEESDDFYGNGLVGRYGGEIIILVVFIVFCSVHQHHRDPHLRSSSSSLSHRGTCGGRSREEEGAGVGINGRRGSDWRILY